jgi:hypothetical protein
VYNLKKKAFLKNLKEIFGPYSTYCYTIEYQKYRLSHLHIAIFIANASFTTPEIIDEVVCVELSNLS